MNGSVYTEFAKRVAEVAAKAKSRHLRNLSSADREDVRQEAVCEALRLWQKFDAAREPLEAFFDRRLNAARQRLRTQQKRDGVPADSDTLVAPDDPASSVEYRAELHYVNAALPGTESDIVGMLADDSTLAETAVACRVTVSAVRRAKRKARELPAPDFTPRPVGDVPRATAKRRSSDDPGGPAAIDIAIEEHLNAQVHRRAECKVCWRCSWFQSNVGAPHHFSASRVVEPEVAAAIEATARAKIAIIRERQGKPARGPAASARRQSRAPSAVVHAAGRALKAPPLNHACTPSAWLRPGVVIR